MVDVSCDLCCRSFKSRRFLEKHLERNFCGRRKSFCGRRKSFWARGKYHPYPSELLICSVCGARLPSMDNKVLDEHWERYHPDANGRKRKPGFPCPLCPEKFETVDLAEEHARNTHEEFEDKPEKRLRWRKQKKPKLGTPRLIKCAWCGVGFITGKRYKDHILENHGRWKYGEPTCPETRLAKILGTELLEEPDQLGTSTDLHKNSTSAEGRPETHLGKIWTELPEEPDQLGTSTDLHKNSTSAEGRPARRIWRNSFVESCLRNMEELKREGYESDENDFYKRAYKGSGIPSDFILDKVDPDDSDSDSEEVDYYNVFMDPPELLLASNRSVGNHSNTTPTRVE